MLVMRLESICESAVASAARTTPFCDARVPLLIQSQGEVKSNLFSGTALEMHAWASGVRTQAWLLEDPQSHLPTAISLPVFQLIRLPQRAGSLRTSRRVLTSGAPV